MARQHPPLVRKFLDRFSRSRDLSISFLIHAIIVAIFGTTILVNVVRNPPPDIVSGQLVADRSDQPKLPPVDPVDPAQQPQPDPTKMPEGYVSPNRLDFDRILQTSQDNPNTMPIPSIPQGVTPTPPAPDRKVATTTVDPDKISPATAQAIRALVESSRRHTGTREAEFDFTAYIGQYSGGNWDSTVEMQGDKVRSGSLPNLLYLMSYWSKDRVKTNYQNVRALKLDSDELLAVKPPFIFLTGTRDFVLTDEEVDNLRTYVRMGGCIWGDSSLPGERSRFDIAFRREMLRVAGSVDQKFEPLPANHPLYTQGYFHDIKGVPKGLNSYQLPVYALKVYGEVAIIYTANDYGDMWQIGLTDKGAIDLRRDAQGRYIAINPALFAQSGIYARNLSPAALEESYKFGMNIVMHLLTRWDDKVSSAAAL